MRHLQGQVASEQAQNPGHARKDELCGAAYLLKPEAGARKNLLLRPLVHGSSS